MVRKRSRTLTPARQFSGGSVRMRCSACVVELDRVGNESLRQQRGERARGRHHPHVSDVGSTRAPMPDDRWASYERTVSRSVVRGRESKPSDQRGRHAAPLALADRAGSAHPDRLGSRPNGRAADSNRVRQAALESYLAAASPPTPGHGGPSTRPRTREEGVAVIALPESDALALGARYARRRSSPGRRGRGPSWVAMGAAAGVGMVVVVPTRFSLQPATDAPI